MASVPFIRKADTLQGSEIEVTATTETAVRAFYIENLIVIPGQESAALRSVFYAVDDKGQPFPQLRQAHPTNPNLLNLSVRVVPASDSSAWAYCNYQIPIYQGASAYIIEDSSSLQSITTNFLPGSRAPIRVGYDSTKDSGIEQAADDGDNSIIIPQDVVPMSLLRPVRSLTVRQIILGRPKYLQKQTGFSDWFNGFAIPSPPGTPPPGFTGAANAGVGPASFVGCVNSYPWLGLPTGYWLLTGFTSRLSKFDNYYETVATAITKNFEDWSEFGILRQKQTGRYVPVSNQELAKARNGGYSYGVQQFQGVVRVGAYPPTDFTGIFGFSS